MLRHSICHFPIKLFTFASAAVLKRWQCREFCACLWVLSSSSAAFFANSVWWWSVAAQLTHATDTDRRCFAADSAAATVVTIFALVFLSLVHGFSCFCRRKWFCCCCCSAFCRRTSVYLCRWCLCCCCCSLTVLHFQCQPPRHRQPARPHLPQKTHYYRRVQFRRGVRRVSGLPSSISPSFFWLLPWLLLSMVKCTLADSIFRVAVNTHQRITWSPLLFLSSSCVSSVRGSQNYLHIAVFAKFWHWKSLAQILSALTPLDRLTAAAVLPFWPISCLRSLFFIWIHSLTSKKAEYTVLLLAMKKWSWQLSESLPSSTLAGI